jgi:regulator of replication initiation timing
MGRLPIVKPNREKGAIHVSDKLVKTLETKVNDLIELSTELKLENQALKKRLADLHEKRDLLERHRRAGDYIDRSINRLNSLESSQ